MLNENLLRMCRNVSPYEHTTPEWIVAYRILQDWVNDILMDDSPAHPSWTTVFQIETNIHLGPVRWSNPSASLLMSPSFGTAIRSFGLNYSAITENLLLIQYNEKISLVITTKSHENCKRGYYITDYDENVPQTALSGLWNVASISWREYYE